MIQLTANPRDYGLLLDIGDARLYCGDCLDILPQLQTETIDAVITDPPYGIDVKTNYRSRGRSALAECNDFKPIVGDDKPFDPTPLLGFPTVILFGANYYADKLPLSSGWIVWDKIDGLSSKRSLGFNDNADCELIWTNLDRVARIIHHRWMGCMKASEQGNRRVHPTQKPIALMVEIINHYTLAGQTIIDPYMGSGTTGVACLKTGRRFIGIEKTPQYFDVACNRIAEVQMQPRLEGFE